MKSPLPSEAEIQHTLLAAARSCGYMVTHFRPAQTARGWRTPIQGNPGFPDLILARNGDVFAFEIKGPRGKLSHAQQDWQAALGGGSPAILEAHVITPLLLDTALDAIKNGRWPTEAGA